MLCNICYEPLEKYKYCLIKHENEKIIDSKKRGHYFHNKCLNNCKFHKCPYDREDIKALYIIKNVINIEDYYDYSLINLELNKIIYDNINKQDMYGRTILYYSCNCSNYSMVKKLVDKGADITISNNNGFTPLMCICSNGDIKILNLLLNNEKIENTLNAVDKHNMSALEYSIKNNNKDVYKILIKKIKNSKNYNSLYIEYLLSKYNIIVSE